MTFRILVSAVFSALVLVRSVSAQTPDDGTILDRSGVPADPAAVFAAAETMESQGKSDAALRTYKSLIDVFPTSPLAAKSQFRIAELLYDSGKASKAFDAYQTLVSKYPDTDAYEEAVAQQVIIANQYLQGRRMHFLGMAILPGTERAQKMYEAILSNAPYSKHAPVAQFNLGLSLERQKMIAEARKAYQLVLDKYPDSDVCDDALYQIAYIYMQQGLTGGSQDLSALVLAKQMFEDFLLLYPKSEKVAQAKDNLVAIGDDQAGDLMRIAKFYDRTKDYKAAVIYYNDVVRKQPKSAAADIAKLRIQELRSQVGDDGLRVGTETAESGKKLALRRRLQAQVETSALANFSGPPKSAIVPDELPIVKTPKFRTNVRDLQPLPAPVEPLLPTE